MVIDCGCITDGRGGCVLNSGYDIVVFQDDIIVLMIILYCRSVILLYHLVFLFSLFLLILYCCIYCHSVILLCLSVF